MKALLQFVTVVTKKYFLLCSQIEVHTAHTSSVQRQNSHPYSRNAARPRKIDESQLEILVIYFIYKSYFLRKY